VRTEPSSPDSFSANRQIARAAGIITLAFLISNLLGLVRQILVADAFGTSAAMEAYNAANRISETLFNLVAGGALGSAFIPTFTSLLAKEKRQQAWRLASSITNLVLIILTLTAALAAIFAPQVVRYILAPGFAADPAKEALTIYLTRLMLPSAVLFGISGLIMGILNSHQKFFIPALTPSMYQIGMIFGVTVLTPRIGIHGLAWGVIIGAALHLILQLPLLFKQGGNYTFSFGLMLMPLAAIAQSIATAALPTFSIQVAQNKLQDMRSSLSATLRGILLLSIPASLGLILLRKPIITLLYQRCEFTPHSTDLVAWALLWYAAGLVGHAMVEILARAFYALHDTKTPVFIGIAAMSLNVLFSFLFSAAFSRLGWMPHGGLALANTLATSLEMVGLLWFMRKRLGGLEGKRIWSGVLKAGLSGGLMAIAIWGWFSLTRNSSIWILGAGGILIGLAVYTAVLWMLKTSELKQIYQVVRSRFK